MVRHSCDIQIKNIDGVFHLFKQFGTPIAFHSKSLWTAAIPPQIYEDIVFCTRKGLMYSAAIQYILNAFKETSKKSPISSPQIFPSITLVLTHDCNLNCPYCFDRFAGPGRLEYSAAVSLILQFANYNKRFRVVFFGGEPLLEFPLLKEIVEFCEELCAKKYVECVSYSITTNGTLLDETMIRFFNHYSFDVTLSVDGLFSYKLNREIGCPPKVLCTNLAELYKNLKKLYIRVTVYPHTVNHIRDLYIELLSLDPLMIAFSPIIDGKYEFMKRDVLNWNRQMEDIIYHRVIESYPCSVNTIDAITNFIRQGIILHHECGAGIDSFAVDITGEKYACHRFVGKKDPADSFIEVEKQKRNKCFSCWAYNLCGGWCKYNVKFAGNSMLSFLCDKRKKEAELACWLTLIVRDR